MQDKQKVTLYIPPELHRKLKVQAAMDSESMSDITQRALTFYLNHGEVVAEVENAEFGHSHRIYDCPNCKSPLLLKDQSLVAITSGPMAENESSFTEDSLDTLLTAQV